jgi:hypothetical protein
LKKSKRVNHIKKKQRNHESSENTATRPVGREIAKKCSALIGKLSQKFKKINQKISLSPKGI